MCWIEVVLLGDGWRNKTFTTWKQHKTMHPPWLMMLNLFTKIKSILTSAEWFASYSCDVRRAAIDLGLGKIFIKDGKKKRRNYTHSSAGYRSINHLRPTRYIKFSLYGQFSPAVPTWLYYQHHLILQPSLQNWPRPHTSHHSGFYFLWIE